jgi:hypothetical protein
MIERLKSEVTILKVRVCVWDLLLERGVGGAREGADGERCESGTRRDIHVMLSL